MKKNLLLAGICLLVFSFTGNAQIKVESNGNVGIGCSPSYGFDFYGSLARFNYSGITGYVRLRLTNTNPRFEHRAYNDKFVFCNGNYGGNWDWTDIECKSVIEKSDSSLKMNFQSLQNNSLSKIMRLKGYSYNWKSDPKGKRRAGLLGQQVEGVIPEAVFTVDSTGEKLLAYSNFIPYLVEAIKEQQKQIVKLEEENSLIKQRLKNLEEGTNKKKKSGNIEDSENNTDQSPRLFQNYPNPFTESTEIEYYLPETVKQASLYIYDMSGNQIKSIQLENTGNGSVTINGGELNPGMYMYTLIANGKEVDTNKMILTE